MVTAIWLSRMGPEEIGLALDSLRDAGSVWGLELIPTIVSVGGRRAKVLQIRRGKLREGPIHPCRSNRDYDHIGILKHLFSRIEGSMIYPLVITRTYEVPRF